MNLLLAVILGVLWVVGFGVLHVTSPAVHIVLVLALVAVVLHFVRGIPSEARFPYRPSPPPIPEDGAPYRRNTAPVAPDLWDGTVHPGFMIGGSPSRLVIARNGRIYDRDTREEVIPVAWDIAKR